MLEPIVDLELSHINSFLRLLSSCVCPIRLETGRYLVGEFFTILANLFGFISPTYCGFDDYGPFIKASFVIGFSFTSMFEKKHLLIIYLILRCIINDKSIVGDMRVSLLSVQTLV